MTDRTVSERSVDPLYRRVRLDHAVEIPVLGVPARFLTNSPDVLATVGEAYGFWHVVSSDSKLIAPQGVRVRIILHDGDEGPHAHAPVSYRMPDDERLLFHTPGSVGFVDVARGEGVAYVTPALVQDRGYFRYTLLDMIVLTLATQRDRQPVHAAVVTRGNRGLLLSGPSGVGKSTLAYASTRRGFRLLSDDAAYVQLRPSFRVWGAPGRVLLPDDADRHFDDLAGQVTELLPSGKTKYVMNVGAELTRAQPPVVEEAVVVMLARHDGPAAVREAGPPEIERFLADGLEEAGSLYRDGGREAIRRIAAPGGWSLTLSPDPVEAVGLLEGIADSLDAPPP